MSPEKDFADEAAAEAPPFWPATNREAADAYPRAELMTGGGWCMYASASFERLVLGCINLDLCNPTIILQHF